MMDTMSVFGFEEVEEDPVTLTIFVSAGFATVARALLGCDRIGSTGTPFPGLSKSPIS